MSELDYPKAFISYSHEDKAIAIRIANALREQAVDAWIDEWEIDVGDSLVQKIFEVGLKDCKLFVILLSPSSIASPWVRHELSSAIVQQLSGVTRVVPLVVQPCEIPVALRPLLRLDLAVEGEAEVVSRLVDVAYGRSKKPPLGKQPSGLAVSVPGLTNHAARIAVELSKSMDQPDGRPLAFSGPALTEALGLNAMQISDGVEELEAQGLVRSQKWFGTAPYSFGHVEPTSSLALSLREAGVLEYDPEEDIRLVAAAIAQKMVVDGAVLQSETGLSPSRINRAVSYLEDYSIARVERYLGTAPFSFGVARRTSATPKFLEANSGR
jgi:hypothetical protein